MPALFVAPAISFFVKHHNQWKSSENPLLSLDEHQVIAVSRGNVEEQTNFTDTGIPFLPE